MTAKTKTKYDPMLSALLVDAVRSAFSRYLDGSGKQAFDLADQMEAAQEEIERLLLQRAVGRMIRSAERISVAPSSDDKPWVIGDIRVGNVVVPPYTDEDRRREEASALRHDPVIARTMIGGPGNHRRIVACACRAPGVRDAASWAAHVGAPGAADYLKTIFVLQDAAQDAVDYPGAETLATLDRVLGRATVVAPGAVSR